MKGLPKWSLDSLSQTSDLGSNRNVTDNARSKRRDGSMAQKIKAFAGALLAGRALGRLSFPGRFAQGRVASLRRLAANFGGERWKWACHECCEEEILESKILTRFALIPRRT